MLPGSGCYTKIVRCRQICWNGSRVSIKPMIHPVRISIERYLWTFNFIQFDLLSSNRQIAQKECVGSICKLCFAKNHRSVAAGTITHAVQQVTATIQASCASYLRPKHHYLVEEPPRSGVARQFWCLANALGCYCIWTTITSINNNFVKIYE